MKRTPLTITLLLAILSAPLAAASGRTVTVRPHVRKNGSYVQPHHRTAPNGTRTDNWSSRGRANPYTGKAGTVDPYKPKTPKN